MRARELLRHVDAVELAGLSSSELAARIGQLVRDGRLAAGIDLPSERDLAEAIGRSRGTIARAYERLREDGLAHTRQGAGTTIGCCAGPWASSRAADLVPILPLVASGSDAPSGRTIDLRRVRWAPGLETESRSGSPGRAEDAGRDPAVGGAVGRIVSPLAGPGLDVDARELVLTTGRLQAVDVALTALARPGDPVLLPELTDPAVLALLRVRGFRPHGLPLDPRGRPDVPGWLRRIRRRSASVVLLAATYAAPHGTALAAHERHLLVEALAGADVALIDDVTDADLWIEAPPPPPMAAFDPGMADRTITVGEVVGRRGPGGALGWLHTPDGALAERVRAVAVALDAMPGDASVGADRGFAPASLSQRRRQHIVDHTAALIRAVTPAVPRLSLAAAEGGPVRWIGVGEVPGSRIADAARTRGVLVEPGAHWQAVGEADPPAVTVSLTGPTEDLLAGVRVLVDVVRDLG